MYRKRENQVLLPHEFFLPFGGKLNENNRWVKLTQLIPWDRVEEYYADLFKPASQGGQTAVSVRMALGSLIIQQRLGTSDRDTVQHITENPYLQYMIGLPEFQEDPPFDASLMTHFRKRLGPDVLNQVNEWIIQSDVQHKEDEDQVSDDDSDGGTTAGNQSTSSEPPAPVPRQGKLLLDATCAPADIAYPTDLSLLNEAREKLERIIDVLHSARDTGQRKPRTYREKARKAYLSLAKQRRVSPRVLRKAVGKQLRFVARDLRIIAMLRDEVGLSVLSRRQYRDLLVIHELYRQQAEMYRKRTRRIDDRIVSISQPHVRPMVRGKARSNVEFGAKVAISLVDGYARIEQLQWDSFNEGLTLEAAVEAYRERYGCYPEAVLADKLYRTRANLQYCRGLGIRLSGPKLGRPLKDEQASQKRIERQDAVERNAIEGKFGEGKRRYGLGLIRARLPETSASVIVMQLLVMNLERKLRLLFTLLSVVVISGFRRPLGADYAV
ncbi:MAG: IS5 family transposase [Alicyclobacillus macrosporangiidus]|uniref:IS5 family transposase n=1 Tax=Alicyclobacillus macrosporangiidus TaxID=392015 RepID=UPI0026F3035A|nr:IS5 family transposase [Alicyclobacillus macrosporangiidus]MCL6600259.1 IS5 family transposase [Alicyclobacillus macrosporangiidus]